MKDSMNVLVAICLTGLLLMLGSVMKEVAESGPVIHKAVSTIVGDNQNNGVN